MKTFRSSSSSSSSLIVAAMAAALASRTLFCGVMAIDDLFVTLLLSGDAEVPPVETTAAGAISMVYRESTNSILWAMEIMNPDNIAMFGMPGAHIHCGNVGENGPVLVPLVGTDMSDNSTEIGRVGEITSDTIVPDLCFGTIAEIWAAVVAGTDLYVNIHSEENPSGELRADVSEVITPLLNSVVAVDLEGSAQVPPLETNATGSATFVYSDVTETIGWVLDISNPNGLGIFGLLSGAQIRCGARGQNGGAIVTLVGPDETDTSETIGVAGLITRRNFVPGLCFDTIPSLWRAMTEGSIVYVNVDSVENPNGEIRGDFINGYRPELPTPEPTNSTTTTPTAMPTMTPIMTTPMPSEATLTPMPSSNSTSSMMPTVTPMPSTTPMPSASTPGGGGGSTEAPSAAGGGGGSTTDAPTTVGSSGATSVLSQTILSFGAVVALWNLL